MRNMGRVSPNGEGYLATTIAVPAGVRPRLRPVAQAPVEVSGHLIQNCVCGCAMFIADEENGLQTAVCVACGVKHQALNMTPAELTAWYTEQYQTYRVDTGRLMDNDLVVANSRLDRYGDAMKGRMLDIGTANGAFVRAARERGMDAWGHDLSKDSLSPTVYAGPLTDIHFPTDHFQTVTMHDVFEHVIDPWEFLAEAHRLTVQGGLLIIDFPDFEAPEGRHHWKKVEHIWLFSLKQLTDLTDKIGFDVAKVDRPMPGRYMLHLTKRKEKRTSILLAPGIGDSFWAIGKLKSFCEKNGLGLPDVWISDMGDKKRSLEAVQKFPFVHAAGYRTGNHGSTIWNEAYMQKGRAVFRDHCGCDYFVASNGGLRHGMSMDQIMPEYAMDWYPPMFISKEESAFRDKMQAEHGLYVVAYFLNVGMYSRWVQDFPIGQIVQTLKKIQQNMGVQILLTGAPWDKGNLPTQIAQLAGNPAIIDFTGKTNFDQLMGLYRGAVGSIGYPSGSTIMGSVVKVPTMMLWNRYFVKEFWKNCCAPDALGHWYGIADTSTMTPEHLAQEFASLCGRDPR